MNDRPVPIPWSVRNIPILLTDLIGKNCRVVQAGDKVTQDIVPGRITIYLDKYSIVKEITIDPAVSGLKRSTNDNKPSC